MKSMLARVLVVGLVFHGVPSYAQSGNDSKKNEKSEKEKGDRGDKGEKGIVGPPGPAGPPGPTGPTGTQGPAGVAGPSGATGAPGPQGIQGNPGAAGPRGPNGDPGAAGAQGIQGLPGSPGVKGDTGLTGAVGPAGPQGAKGDTGVSGAQGPAGSNGPQGPAGAIGPQGPRGVQGLQGPAGAQGPTGDTGAPGTAGPQGPAGIGAPLATHGPTVQGFGLPAGNTGILGTGVIVNCPSDAVMTGIDGTDNGNEIVSLSAVCKKSNTIARVGPAGLYLAFDGPSSTTSTIGPAVGAPFSLGCDSGELVIGIFGKVTFLGKVRSINLQCAPLLSTGPTSSAGPGGAPELLLDAPYEITCTAALPGLRGYAAWGLHASVNGSGDIVSLTLRCR